MKYVSIVICLLLCTFLLVACVPIPPQSEQISTEQKTQVITQEQPTEQQSTQQSTQQNTEQQSEQTSQTEQVTTEEQTTFGPLHFPEDTTE